MPRRMGRPTRYAGGDQAWPPQRTAGAAGDGEGARWGPGVTREDDRVEGHANKTVGGGGDPERGGRGALNLARAINEKGQIVGWGKEGLRARTRVTNWPARTGQGGAKGQR